MTAIIKKPRETGGCEASKCSDLLPVCPECSGEHGIGSMAASTRIYSNFK
jgi:hypothetical protein